VLGLLDAIETFGPVRETEFVPYAISSSGHPGQATSPGLGSPAGTGPGNRPSRAPTEEEIVVDPGLDIDEYRTFLSQYSRTHVGSLEDRLEIDGNFGAEHGTMPEDKPTKNPQHEANRMDLRAQLIEAIGNLGEQERLVATFTSTMFRRSRRSARRSA